MKETIRVQPLPKRTRQRTFGLLLLIFVIAIPFLYLYATGYRLDLAKPTNLVSTGGISLAVPLADAEIFVDGDPVRGARTFRKVYYVQGVDAGTHRVHVQKDGYHTWVKELPVSERLVTEAEAFNLPIVPQVRVIAPYVSATGTMIVPAPLIGASTTNEVLATTTKSIKAFTPNPEFTTLLEHFGTTSTSTKAKQVTSEELLAKLASGTTTPPDESPETATTTIIRGDVKLYQRDEDVYATWTGAFDSMPYYFCAPDFPRYSTSSATATPEVEETQEQTIPAVEPGTDEEVLPFIHPVQTVPQDTACDPTILMDRKWQTVLDFDFYPGSSDFVVMVLADGLYVVEIDDRAWQNVQPFFLGNNLRLYVENGTVYVYDGNLIYELKSTIEA